MRRRIFIDIVVIKVNERGLQDIVLIAEVVSRVADDSYLFNQGS